jgi:hypothetical protein
VVASSPAIVTVTSVLTLATEISSPSPPVNCKSSVSSATSAVVPEPSVASTVRVAATSVKVTPPLPSVMLEVYMLH